MPATETRVVPDLLAIQQRTLQRLTPEGAQSWYVNDVTALLDELLALQHQIGEARAAFAEDGVEGADKSLYELATQWKAQATGIYEKAVVKKLKAEAAQLHSELENAVLSLGIELQNRDEARAKVTELQERISLLEDQLVRKENSHSAEMQAEQAELVRLHDEVAKLNTALVECSERCESVLAMAETQHAEKLTEAMEHIAQAWATLGGKTS